MKPTTLIITLALVIGIIIMIAMSSPSTPSTITKATGVSFVQSFKTTPRAVLIDVRTPQEYAEGHIPGALNIDIEGDAFVSSIEALDHSAPYFVYCRSGNRSGQAVAFMKQQGFTNITELSGGILAAPSLVQ